MGTNENSGQMTGLNLRKFIIAAVFSAISFVVMYFIELPLFYIPVPILKYNPSDIPAIIIGFKFGILPGILVIVFRDILFLFSGKSTFVIGVFMNAASSGIFVFSAALIYKYYKTMLGAISGLLVATAVSAALMLPLNFAVLQLFFPEFMPYLVYFVVFNVSKGIFNSILTFILYKKLSGLLQGSPEVIRESPDKDLDEQKVLLFKSLAKLVKDNPSLKIPETVRKQWDETHDNMEKFEDIIKGKK